MSNVISLAAVHAVPLTAPLKGNRNNALPNHPQGLSDGPAPPSGS
jgi:hypothetical protein